MSKIIDLFGNSGLIPNPGMEYSKLLDRFVAPFENEFPETFYIEDIFEFAINAWNLANVKLLMPEEEMEKVMSMSDSDEVFMDLLEKMVEYKITHFKEYTNFIADYELKEVGKETVLTVITQEQDDFLTTMFEGMEGMGMNTEVEYEENYINRTALIVKSLQPYKDWIKQIDSELSIEENDTNTYLISEDIEDIEAWVKKNYRRIFDIELSEGSFNKKEWPKKQDYKTFKEWFHVGVSLMVYDFEAKPVSKSF